KIKTRDEGVQFKIGKNGGEAKFNDPPGSYNTSFGKAEPVLEDLKNSEFTMRFNPGERSGDQRFRLWLRTDGWQSDRSTYAENGYGIELNKNNNEISLVKRMNKENETLNRIDLNWSSDEWLWLKFKVENDQLKV